MTASSPSEPLKNVRQERFCLALAEGMSATSAYLQAGYKQSASATANAARLITSDNVRARLAHLQAMAAKNSEVTVQSLLAELEHARVRADSLDQLSAVVKSISEKAKISGLLVQKVEVGNAGAFTDRMTYEEIADEMLSQAGGPIGLFRPVDQRDRQGLIELVERVASQLGEYLDAIRARPVVAERVDLAKLPTDWRLLRPYSASPAPRRLTNGSQR